MQTSSQASSALQSGCHLALSDTKVAQRLGEQDFAVLDGPKFLSTLNDGEYDPEALASFRASWDDLEPDNYMADGGKYRLRRHATLTAERSGGAVRVEPHQPHFQTVSYNRLNGGVERHFAPVLASTLDNPVMQDILVFASRTFGALAPFSTWHVEMHQFRIEAVPDGGKPTPEGIHRDGVHFVLMTLVSRENVVNGETAIHDLEGKRLKVFTLAQPFDSALVNDERVAHGVTPIMRLDPEQPGHRDVLVLTFRRK